MLTFTPHNDHAPLTVLVLGAHCDDIELGCGGTILSLLESKPAHVHWVVFSSNETRAREARHSAGEFLKDATENVVLIESFRNGYFPSQWSAIKDCFELLKTKVQPDLIFTHHREDQHQDHRTVAELTWNTFRSNQILEYEIVKYDGDLKHPNVFHPLSPELATRKCRLIYDTFVSQRDKQWFDRETFMSLMRIRGVEIDAQYAEAFHAKKVRIAW